MKKFNIITAALLFLPQLAYAGICDYRLSNMIGGAATTAVGAGAGTTVATGLGGKALGLYTLTHAGSGLTMLGSTLGGASGAGTVGILGGTAGALGVIGGIVTAPLTLVVGGIVVAAVGISEGACFFTDERITDTDEIRGIMKNLASTANPKYFRYQKTPTEAIFVGNEDGDPDMYIVENLYIVNGVLKHSDWGINSIRGCPRYLV